MKTAHLLALGLVVAAFGSACSDPVHDGEVAALGPEPGGSPGPTHRPGQPCNVCHGGLGPAGKQFSVAGTVFQAKLDPQPQGCNGVSVQLADKNMAMYTATTNSAGNFYVLQADWVPAWPTAVALDYGMGTLQAAMTTHMGLDGSCASCHFGTPGPNTSGPVYLAIDPMDISTAGACQ
jgi:hypothetical protein